MMSHRPLAFLLLAVAACGGASGVPIGAADAGPQAQEDAGTTPAPDAALPDDSGAPDASAPSDAGSDAAPADAPIDPLTIGNTWTFEVTEVGTYPLCPSGTHDGAVLWSGQRDGKLAYEVSSFCANAGNLYYAEDGDVVYWDDAATWVLVLDAPVKDGHSWSNGVTTYEWHDVGTVTVPAGSFSKCFKAQDTSGPSFSVFCRGVGPVQWSYRDVMGNGYDAVLSAKSF